MEVVIKFSYNNKIYGIINDKNKLIPCILKGNDIIYELSLEEETLINSIIDKLVFSNTLIKVHPLTINNNRYDIYYDKGSKLYLFDPMPLEKDLVILNNLLNNRDEYLYQNKKDKDNNHFKTLIQLGSEVIIVYVLSSFCLNNLSGMYQEYKTNKELAQYYEISSESYSLDEDSEVVDEILASLDANPNLTDAEKDHIASYRYVLEDNINYLDTDLIKERFESLKVKYESDAYESISGTYSPTKNVITIYSANSFEYVIGHNMISTFTHELSHALSKEYNSNPFLTEGINTIFNNEYFGPVSTYGVSYDAAYSEMVTFTKAMAEVLGGNYLKLYHARSDESIIKNALMEIIDDETKADKFLELMREYATIVINDAYGYEVEDNLDSIMEELVSTLGTYYEAKYSRDMSSDLVMLYYLDYGSFRDEVKKLYNVSEDEVLFIANNELKCYINSAYVDNDLSFHLNIDAYEEVDKVPLDYSEYLGKLTIDESNRYIEDAITR